MRDQRYPQKPVATLTVTGEGTHKTNLYRIEIDMAARPSLALRVLADHMRTNIIEGKAAADWIASRATPAGRQNIDEVLKAVSLVEYDAWGIVLGHHCRCTRDYLYMEEVK